ncbi:hypothetical protein KEM54_001701 [Ascosphaera aggregata]|nr:hypothetical protein KEM54_001701 [Ascosphaera aggregata]
MFRSTIRTPLAAANAAARAFSTSAARPYARVQLIGNLGSDPELVATSTGREIIRYTLAVQASRSDPSKVSWFRISSFAEGSQREFLLGMTKGSKVFVDGDISTRSFEDAEGKKTTSVNIVQRQLEVLRRKVPQSTENAEEAAPAETA